MDGGMRRSCFFPQVKPKFDHVALVAEIYIRTRVLKDLFSFLTPLSSSVCRGVFFGGLEKNKRNSKFEQTNSIGSSVCFQIVLKMPYTGHRGVTSIFWLHCVGKTRLFLFSHMLCGVY